MIFFAGVLFGVVFGVLLGVFFVRRIKANVPERNLAVVEPLNPEQVEAWDPAPLQIHLQDPDVTEIMVNSPSEIFIETRGRLLKSEQKFLSLRHQQKIFEKLCAVHEIPLIFKNGAVHGRMKDRSLVSCVRSEGQESFVVRKYKAGSLSLEKYIQWGVLDQRMADVLRISVENGIKILVSGSQGSGKITLLKTLINLIPRSERIVCLEIEEPLTFEDRNLVSIRSSANPGRQEIAGLTESMLRLRPDRIVLGEITVSALSFV